MPYKQTLRAGIYGIIASGILLILYFIIVTFVSGWGFARDQFSAYWYFIVSLAVGFGIQIGLYAYLRNSIKGLRGDGKIVGVTGVTSTAAMVSCCVHYLANLLPILGVVGVVTFVTQYQVQLFWLGLFFNLGGILFILHRIIRFKRT